MDHFTIYIWFYPLKRKSQVRDVFVRFKSLVENHFLRKIITLYSDNRGEYQALSNYQAINGVSHLTSPPHTPEHNGYDERCHRHIVETGLSLISHASMPLTYWSFAFSTFVYLINRFPTPTLDLIPPYHKLFGAPPNYSKLCSFGCLCYPWLRPYSPHKLTPHSSPCVFIGYSLTQSAYLCLDTSLSRIYTLRHVKFVESIFPFTTTQPNHEHPTHMTPSHWTYMSLPVTTTSSPRSDSTPPMFPLPNASPLTSSSPSTATPNTQRRDAKLLPSNSCASTTVLES